MAQQRLFGTPQQPPQTPLAPLPAGAANAPMYRESDARQLKASNLYKAVVAGPGKDAAFFSGLRVRDGRNSHATGWTFREMLTELNIVLRDANGCFGPLLYLPATPAEDFAEDYVFSPAGNKVL